MNTTELIFFCTTVAFYLLAFVVSLFYGFFAQDKLARLSTWALRLGSMAHSITFVLRWYYAGHFPLGNTYESNLSSTLIAMLIFLALQLICKDYLALVAIFASAIAVSVLLIGILLDPSMQALSAAYNSPWLFVHVFFAWFAFGCFAVATAFAGVYLLKSYRPETLVAFYPLDKMDRMMYKLVALGVLFHAVMIVAGAIWAKNLWGNYWAWDPVETWSLIAFIGYLLYLHVHSFWKAQGRVAAWLLLLSFVFLAIMFWGLPYVVPNVHVQSPMGK